MSSPSSRLISSISWKGSWKAASGISQFASATKPPSASTSFPKAIQSLLSWENPYAIGPYEPALLYYANVEERNGSLFTRSSRTLAFVGLGETLSEAERIAETAASNVEGRVRHRRDIGTKELLDRRIAHMRELR